jgi:hypothetical protein
MAKNRKLREHEKALNKYHVTIAKIIRTNIEKDILKIIKKARRNAGIQPN